MTDLAEARKRAEEIVEHLRTHYDRTDAEQEGGDIQILLGCVRELADEVERLREPRDRFQSMWEELRGHYGPAHPSRLYDAMAAIEARHAPEQNQEAG